MLSDGVGKTDDFSNVCVFVTCLYYSLFKLIE